jgi:hypothetical protein
MAFVGLHSLKLRSLIGVHALKKTFRCLLQVEMGVGGSKVYILAHLYQPMLVTVSLPVTSDQQDHEAAL